MATDTTTRSAPPEQIRAVPVRHPGRWVGVAVIAVLVAMLVHSFLTNPNFQWDVVGQYLFSEPVLRGLRNTLILTALSMVIGIVGGVLLAVMRLSPNPVLAGAAAVYVWLFRGTPLITQLIFWNFLAALYPRLGLGIPFGPTFVSVDTNAVISVFAASLLGLGLNEAAYMAEIVRGGIQSVDPGQSEAAGALGLSRTQTLRRIVLPQAMRVIVPPTGNETIAMVKDTSLLIALPVTAELFYQLQAIGSRTYQTFPTAVAAVLWYLIICSVLMVIQARVEKYFGRGFGSTAPSTKDQAARARMLSLRGGGGGR